MRTLRSVSLGVVSTSLAFFSFLFKGGPLGSYLAHCFSLRPCYLWQWRKDLEIPFEVSDVSGNISFPFAFRFLFFFLYYVGENLHI